MNEQRFTMEEISDILGASLLPDHGQNDCLSQVLAIATALEKESGFPFIDRAVARMAELYG